MLALLTIALRLGRAGLIGMSLVGLIFGAVQPAGYLSAAPTPADRVILARQSELLAVQMSYMLPLPRELDTLSGYMQWRVFGSLPILLSFWAVFAAAGAARGDEERGLVDHWLGAGVSRARYLLVRLGAFAIAAAVAIGLLCLTLGLVSLTSDQPLRAAALAGQGVALWSVTLVAYALVLAVAQLAGNRRSAAGAGGALLLGLFFLNSFSRTNESLSTLRWLSPFAYYDRTDALLSGGGLDVPATLGLLGAALALTGVAALAYGRRDVGEALLRRSPREVAPVVVPSRNPLLRTIAFAGLYEQRIGLLFWLIGIALPAMLFVSLAKQLVELMQNTPSLQTYMQFMLRSGSNPYEAFLGFALFGIIQLLLALYVTTQVARWAAEDAEGRLELVLSAAVPRWRVPLERGVTLALSCAVLAAGNALIAAISAWALDVTLAGTKLLVAAALLVPLTLAFGGVGAALAAFAPRAAMVVLAAFALCSYFVQQVGSLFKWPDWLLNLSLFQLYGAPLAQGVNWDGLWALLVVTVLGFGVAARAMQLRDVGR
jgi:ABC-2 type transport system permease protein